MTTDERIAQLTADLAAAREKLKSSERQNSVVRKQALDALSAAATARNQREQAILDLAAARAEVERLTKLTHRWNRAASAHGPCGSEFHDDPERVFDSVLGTRNTLMGAVRRHAAAKREAWSTLRDIALALGLPPASSGEAVLAAVRETEQATELRQRAEQRAIALWRAEAPGRELTSPDHAELCVWLMRENERLRGLVRDAANIVEAARKIRHWHNTGRDDEGMVVSTRSVFGLWEALKAYDCRLDAALESAPASVPDPRDGKLAVMEWALETIAGVEHDYPGDAFWFMRETARTALNAPPVNVPESERIKVLEKALKRAIPAMESAWQLLEPIKGEWDQFISQPDMQIRINEARAALATPAPATCPDMSLPPCPHCGGRGDEGTEGHSEGNCRHCDGTGRAPATCPRCGDTRTISVKYGRTYLTDSDDEIERAYRDVPCPDCQERESEQPRTADVVTRGDAEAPRE